MPNLYARQTALHDIRGRLDYIGNSERQEHLLATHDAAAELLQGTYWRTLSQECQRSYSQHSHAGKQAVEGREIVIQLSNSLLDRMEPEQICQTLAASFQETYNRPAVVALHYNKAESNLHAHLIYSERELLSEPIIKTARQALYYDETGKRRYKKADILDPESRRLRDGCRIVKKGEVYEKRHFSATDSSFSFKSWLRDAKKQWILPLLNGPLMGDLDRQIFDYSAGKLPQQHVGKNLPEKKARAVQTYNAAVKEYNALIDTGIISQEQALAVQGEIIRLPEGKLQTLQWLLDEVINLDGPNVEGILAEYPQEAQEGVWASQEAQEGVWASQEAQEGVWVPQSTGITKTKLEYALRRGETVLSLFRGCLQQEDGTQYFKSDFCLGDEIVYIADCFHWNIAYPMMDPELYERFADRMCYTGNDFLAVCGGDVDLAKRIFSYCGGDHPESVLRDYLAWIRDRGQRSISRDDGLEL